MILIFVDLFYPHNNAEHTKQSKYPYMAAIEILEYKNEIIIKYTNVKNRIKSELCLFSK